MAYLTCPNGYLTTPDPRFTQITSAWRFPPLVCFLLTPTNYKPLSFAPSNSKYGLQSLPWLLPMLSRSRKKLSRELRSCHPDQTNLRPESTRYHSLRLWGSDQVVPKKLVSGRKQWWEQSPWRSSEGCFPSADRPLCCLGRQGNEHWMYSRHSLEPWWDVCSRAQAVSQSMVSAIQATG